MNIPELEQYCGSWIVVDRATGGAVVEIWERSTVEKVNQNKYEVKTAAQYLGGLNRHD